MKSEITVTLTYREFMLVRSAMEKASGNAGRELSRECKQDVFNLMSNKFPRDAFRSDTITNSNSNLSDDEIEDTILNDDEKRNVSGYTNSDGSCSFNACGGLASSYVEYKNGKPTVKGRQDGNTDYRDHRKDKIEKESKDLGVTYEDKVTDKGTKYREYKQVASARVSGDCCSLIGTAFHAKGGDVSNLRIHGDDVDVIIETTDGVTELSATFLGDDSYEVEELDDGANLFSFDVGDVVSGDDIRMVLIKLALEE